MDIRGTTTRIPIWVRAPAAVAGVLVGVFASAMLVGASGVGDSNAPDQMQQEGGNPDSGGDHDPSGGNH